MIEIKKSRLITICIIIGIVLIGLISAGIIINIHQDKKNKERSEALEILKKYKEISVFLELDVTPGDIERIKTDLLSIEDISEVRFLSNVESFEQLKEALGNPDATDGIDPEILPNTFIVTLNFNKIDNIEELDKTVKRVLKNISKIEGVDEYREILSTLIEIYKGDGIEGLKRYTSE